MLVMTSISPTLLLYMNHAGFTDQKHIAPYVTASAFSSAVPIFTNVLFGRIASASGPGNALVVAALFPALGLLIVVLSRNSLILFYIGYAMYASCNSLRTIRVSILTKVVPEHERTTVLATHALMTPIGALIGPLLWILISQYRSSFNITFLTFDRFSITYLIAVGTLLAIAAISVVLLGRIVAIDGTGDATGADVEPDSLGDVVIHRLDGRDSTVNLDEYRNAVFRYFCFIMLGVNISAGIYMTAFQPVLINVFNTSDAKLGVIFEMIAVFAVLPPLLVALLSRHLMDRHILLIGLTSKIFGMLLFLPLFGPVREWQVIVGFLLIVKASIFFSTASMSLFTKLLGSMTTSSLIGLLASGSSVGPALAQILLSKHIVELFGGYWFGLFAVPAVISMGAIALPKFWKRLDPSLEFTRLVTHEAGERRNGAHQ